MIGVKKCTNREITGQFANTIDQEKDQSSFAFNSLQMPRDVFSSKSLRVKPNTNNSIRAQKTITKYRYAEQQKGIIEKMFNYIFG